MMGRMKRYFLSTDGNKNSPCKMVVCCGVVELWCLKQVVLRCCRSSMMDILESRTKSLARGVVW